MKRLLLLGVLLVSVSALAQSPYDVCNGLFSSADKIKCMETVKNRQFDPGALKVCESLFSSSDKINCLATTADRAYVPEEIKICGDLFSSQDKVSCLSKAGNGVMCPNAVMAKMILNQVLNEIVAGNYRGAYSTANSLLDRYQACQ